MLLKTIHPPGPQAELLASGYVLELLPHDIDLLRRQIDSVLAAIHDAEKRHLDLQMQGGGTPEELAYLQSVIQSGQRRIDGLLLDTVLTAYHQHGRTATVRVEDGKALVFFRAKP
jgi:hypothetical protein